MRVTSVLPRPQSTHPGGHTCLVNTNESSKRRDTVSAWDSSSAIQVKEAVSSFRGAGISKPIDELECGAPADEWIREFLRFSSPRDSGRSCKGGTNGGCCICNARMLGRARSSRAKLPSISLQQRPVPEPELLPYSASVKSFTTG
jgi:hypothetical protein